MSERLGRKHVTAVRFRTSYDDLVEQELRVALKMLAHRIRFLEAQIADIEARLRPIIAEHFPALLGLGKTVRFRLDRGGSRHANRALYRIVIVRMRHDDDTKRYVAREVFGAIINPPDKIPTGRDLRAARTAAGITLTSLAVSLSVAPTDISRLERGIDHHTTRVHQALETITAMTT